MKIRWPWQRRRTPAVKPAREPQPDDAAADEEVVRSERGWHRSSSELHDGLKVVEDADVTIPGDLLPGDKRRRP